MMPWLRVVEKENHMSLAYTVTADFDELAVAAEWVQWLKDGHLDQVLQGGALEATVVRLEPTATAPLRFEARYRFASMAAFTAYEQGPAQALRADSLARFPAARGVRMSRSLGEILESKSR